MGSIYIIKNDINNKVYIGQTVHKLDARLKQHFVHAKYSENNPTDDSHFMRAIRKYGSEHFYIEELENCDDILLNIREQYWISCYDSYKNGYNSTIGGDGRRKYTREELLALWNRHKCLKEIREVYGITKGCFNIFSNEDWYKEEHAKSVSSRQIERQSKTVYQYDYLGNWLAKFASVKEAADAVGCTPSNITTAVIKNQAAKGYRWSYERVEKMNVVATKRRLIIFSVDKNGKKQTYYSLRQAEQASHIGRTTIKKLIDSKMFDSFGRQWYYLDMEDSGK